MNYLPKVIPKVGSFRVWIIFTREFPRIAVLELELSKLKIEREISKRRLFVGDTISSSIVMQNDGFRTIGLVKLSQDIPIEFKSLGKSKSYAINLAPGEKIKFEYELEAIQMGRINFGNLN